MSNENIGGAKRPRIDDDSGASDSDSNHGEMNDAQDNEDLNLELSDDEPQSLKFIDKDLPHEVARTVIEQILGKATCLPHIRRLLYGDENNLEWSDWNRYFKRQLVNALFLQYSTRFPNSNAQPSRTDALALRDQLAHQFPNKFGLGQIWNRKLHSHAYELNKDDVKDGLRDTNNQAMS